MSKFPVLFVLAALIGISYGICFWPRAGGVINLCKNTGKTGCVGGMISDNNCKNLPNNAIYKSGYSSGSYSCKIFSSTGCKGTIVSVDRAGWSKFPITPKSIKCPCI